MLSNLILTALLCQVPVPAQEPVKVETKDIVQDVIADSFAIEKVENVPIFSGFTTISAAVGEKILLSTKGTITTSQTSWIIYPMNPNATLEPGNMTASFVSDKAGSYWLVSSVSVTSGPPKLSAVVIIVGSVEPEPPTPDPPGPVDDKVIPLPGFRVLCKYDSQQGQPRCFAAKSVHDYLNSHCVKGEDNITPERRIWDENVTPDGDFASWTLMTERLKNVPSPAAVISTGKVTVIVPCKDSEGKDLTPEAFLEILKKYGGV